MKSFASVTLALLSAVVLTLPQAAHAATAKDPKADSAKTAAAPNFSGQVHFLQRTKIDYTAGGQLLYSGYNTVDQSIVTCNFHSGCTEGFGVMAQVGGNSFIQDEWAICALVDGRTTHPGDGCPIQGELLPDGNYVVGNSRQNLNIPYGNHTVTVEIYVDFGQDAGDDVFLGESEFDYLLYQP